MDLKDFSPSQLKRMSIQPTRGKRESEPAPKASKYKNVRVIVQGEKFHSQHEADTWLILRAREQLGDISDLRRQVPIPIYVPVFVDGKPTEQYVQLCVFVADFVFLDKGGHKVTMDAKGQKKRICPYPLKAKALALSYGIQIVEV